MDDVPRWRVGDPAPPPLPRRAEADVVARWQDGPPLVSVLCPTYQHVDFIEDALQGFLGQDTDFPFEVIVRDDASSDGTADIVREYAERYPSVIRAILEPVNTFRDTTPFDPLRSIAQGKYLTICEGDDYWISPRNLAHHTALLEERSDVAVSINASVAIRDGRVLGASDHITWTELSAYELRRAPVVGIREACFRASALQPWRHEAHVPGFDTFLYNRSGLFGGAHRARELYGTVFRVHSGGIWSSKSDEERAILKASTHYWIGLFFKEAGDESAAEHHLARASEVIHRSELSAGVDPRPKLLAALVRGVPSMIRRRIARRRARRA